MEYDYIIIGSGFGGSVSALRLSEKGYKVLVIEKGKWYKSDDFPKTNWNLRKWLWMPRLGFYGIMKISAFRHILALSGTGVGGGSLVYANTLPIPTKNFYSTGSWASLADWQEELKPFYAQALKMLGATQNPKLYDADMGLKALAKQMGKEDKFEATEVSVFFGEADKTVPDPYFDGEGPDKTACTFCGGCMTGCRYGAKNTLDTNYLHLAQKKGAEIISEQEVIDVKPDGAADGSEGYTIKAKSISLLGRTKSYKAMNVIFSGGVVGTVKLLLKLKQDSLPNLSDKIGDDIRTNNETLISVSSLDKETDFSKGVAIGSILHTDENSHLEPVRYAEGSGFWKILHFPYVTGSNIFIRLGKLIGKIILSPIDFFRVYFVNSWSKKTTVLLFMQTIDSTLHIKRGLFGALISRVSSGKKPTAFIPESIELTKSFAKIVNGKATAMVTDTLVGIPSTAHILGGAVMGADASKGVIDKDNRVFGYQNMMVCDGAAISANPGVNPSLSITAISEHAMAKIPKQRS
ncbi:MAG: GMC family oxidoreductase [Bacteroidales bacterium]|nr:GMC family oxidoreductase [Bacteroidales bacterium]